jgi:hypothetical protein
MLTRSLVLNTSVFYRFFRPSHKHKILWGEIAFVGGPEGPMSEAADSQFANMVGTDPYEASAHMIDRVVAAGSSAHRGSRRFHYRADETAASRSSKRCFIGKPQR